jgi:methylmalonyl-CoA mutase N-terminal domain/subunit
LERQQATRTRELRANRDPGAVDKALAALDEAAQSDDNLLYPMKEALAAYATLGEVSDVLRNRFGEYRPSR